MTALKKRLALLVIDMQEHFRPVTGGIIDNINSLINTCKENGIPVIYTQHGHKDLSVDGGSLLDHWGKDNLIIYGTENWKLLPELNVLPEAPILDEKRRYNAFWNTRLQDILAKDNVKTIIISGVLSNLCCESTSRSAFDRNFHIVFLSDGNAANSDEMHQATLNTIKLGFGKVMTCKEVGEIIKDGSTT